MAEIAKAWMRIEQWLVQNAPREYCLPDGANDELIEEAESRLGFSFPKQVRESYRIHNGSNRIWMFEQGYLMPIFKPRHLSKRKQSSYSEVVDSWEFMRDMLHGGSFDSDFMSSPDGPIQHDWWNERWLPVTCNDCGDHVCVDLCPAKGGRKGQLIDWWHEQGATNVVAGSFSQWLSTTADRFDAGVFVYDEESNKLTKVK